MFGLYLLMTEEGLSSLVLSDFCLDQALLSFIHELYLGQDCCTIGAAIIVGVLGLPPTAMT